MVVNLEGSTVLLIQSDATNWRLAFLQESMQLIIQSTNFPVMRSINIYLQGAPWQDLMTCNPLLLIRTIQVSKMHLSIFSCFWFILPLNGQIFPTKVLSNWNKQHICCHYITDSPCVPATDEASQLARTQRWLNVDARLKSSYDVDQPWFNIDAHWCWNAVETGLMCNIQSTGNWVHCAQNTISAYITYCCM